jgi:tol-pal system protein YbgF
MRGFCTAFVFFAATPLVFGASKEIVELQRDVAMLQDQVRTLQRSVDEKVSAVQTLLQQTLDASNRTNNAIAVMQDRFNDALKQQQQSVTGPVASVGTKLEQMSEDFRAVRETVLDMNSRMGKLDAKLADLQNTINIIKNPPAAPPPVTGVGGTSPAATGQPAGPPPGMNPESTYTNAFRDYTSGSYDLAMQEFTDYLKYFPNTQFAPNAQYYIGDIYSKRKDYENAIQAFDAVLEHYSENSKTAAAHYKKGEALLALGRRDAAAREFRDIVAHFSDSEVAPRAKAQLRDLGLSTTGGAASRSKRR